MCLRRVFRALSRPLRHQAHGPASARELARGGDVRLVLVDPALQQGGAPPGEPPHPLRRMPPGSRVGRLARGQVLRVGRGAQVVPRRLHHHPPQVLVAGLRDAAPGDLLPAGVLGGDEPEPRGERPRVPEPRELPGLEDDVGRGHDVDALQAPQGVDPLPPPRLGRLFGHQPLQAPLVLPGLPDRVDVEGECVIVRLLGKGDRLYPGPVGASPVALSSAGRVDLVEDQPVAQQELGEPLLLALQVLAGVVQGAHQVAGGLALVVGHPHLHDVAHRQHPGQELRVVAVVLPAPVGGGLYHLGDRADDAVDAEGGQPLLQVEPGHARLVDASGRGVDGPDPVGHGAGVVAEGCGFDLPGHGVERDRLDRARVHVQAYERGNIHHESPFHECGVAATVD